MLAAAAVATRAPEQRLFAAFTARGLASEVAEASHDVLLSDGVGRSCQKNAESEKFLAVLGLPESCQGPGRP
jgi:hypothetical protein